MFFSSSSHKKSSSPIVSFFRLILTIFIFGFMIVGLYVAFQGFSGVDPMTINPKAVVQTILQAKDPKAIVENLSNLDLQKVVEISQNPPSDLNTTQRFDNLSNVDTNKPVAFSFLLVSDSHNENDYLKKALEQGKSQAINLAFIIGLGDYTEVGTLQDLKKAKAEFDSAGIRYFVIPGDHDLWDGRDKTDNPLVNFETVFGVPYQSFVYQGVKFILIDNADNYTGIDQKQLDWVDSQLAQARTQDNAKLVFAFVHEPLYHPSSTHVMGRVEESVKKQAKNLITVLKSGGVNEVFSGDLHFFTRYSEPQIQLPMTTIGAALSARNTQAPRFAIVSVYEDGTYGVEDIEIK